MPDGNLKLDTSGEVMLSVAQGIPAEVAGGHRWSDLDAFTQGYIEALFESLPPTFAPLTLRGLTYGEVLGQMRATGCAGRRNHWCAPVLAYRGTRLVLDDEDNDRPWKATAEDRRATDWEMAWPDGEPKQAYAFSDLASETLARIIADCERLGGAESSLRTAHRGRDYWNTRQHGGCLPGFPPQTPYLGDDGRVYLRESV